MGRPHLTAVATVLAVCSLAGWPPPDRGADDRPTQKVEATSLRGKVLCGYQGWFRCPGDAARQGWVHWSRDSQRLAPNTLTFDMWPDMSEYPVAERYAAPGFTHPGGQPAYLF